MVCYSIIYYIEIFKNNIYVYKPFKSSIIVSWLMSFPLQENNALPGSAPTPSPRQVISRKPGRCAAILMRKRVFLPVHPCLPVLYYDYYAYLYIYYIIYGLFEYMLHHFATYILMCVAYFFIRYPSTLYLHQQYYYPFWGRLSPGLGRVHSKALRRSAGRPPTDSVDSNRCLLVCVFDVNVVNHMV